MMKENLCKVFWISLLLALTYLFTGLCIAIGNQDEFTFFLNEALIGTGIVALVIFCFFLLFQSAFCFFLPKYSYQVMLACLILAICGYLQANVLLWKIEIAGGTLLGFENFDSRVLTELILYGIVIGLVCRFYLFFYDNIKKLSLVLIGVQIIGLISSYMAGQESLFVQPSLNYSDNEMIPEEKYFAFKNEEGKYHFSDQNNIIVLILDTLGENYYSGACKNSGGNLQNDFRDFTHFSHLISPNPWTQYAVPMLMTGSDVFEENTGVNSVQGSYFERKKKAYQSPWNLFKNCSQNGFRCDVVTFFKKPYPVCKAWIANLECVRSKHIQLSLLLSDRFFPMVNYRFSLLVLKKPAYLQTQKYAWTIYNCIQKYFYGSNIQSVWSKGDQIGFSDMSTSKVQEQQENIRSNTDSFFWNMEPHFRMDHQKQFFVCHLQSVHVHGINEKSYEREHYIQLAQTDLEHVVDFLKYLKERDIYDNSYIVIVGDHGSYREPEYHQNPFLLIKQPQVKQEKIVENTENILMRDIAPTILSDLGISPDAPSIWNLSPAEKAEREKFWNNRNNKIEFIH